MAQLKEGSIIKKSTGDEVIATVKDIPNTNDLMPKSGLKCNYNVFFFLRQNYFRFRNYQCCLAVLNY